MIRVTWKDREGMIKRGVRMVKAHWGNRINWDTIEGEWYRKVLPRYAKISYGNKTGNAHAIRLQFLKDIIRLAYPYDEE